MSTTFTSHLFVWNLNYDWNHVDIARKHLNRNSNNFIVRRKDLHEARFVVLSVWVYDWNELGIGRHFGNIWTHALFYSTVNGIERGPVYYGTEQLYGLNRALFRF